MAGRALPGADGAGALPLPEHQRMMKFLPLEMLMTLMSKGAARKHESSVRLFAVILILSLAVFSIAFRYIMLYEGQ